MEASALHPPARFARLSSAAPLLKLRSDEQLIFLLRQGHEEAFRVIHDRYGQRLFAYVRQMLGAGSRQDAEDVLQDVFARAYIALRGDTRDISLRPWLYRIAHNRCIDHMRRATPPTTELFETVGRLHDPFEDVQRREDLRRLVADIGRLPEYQRSALLMRELDGLSYRDLAEALEVTVPAVKSLLVRARVELVETAEARAADCAGIREELLEAYDRGVRTPPRARRHLRECSGCQDYRAALRGMRKSFAALSPVAAAGPLALVGKLVGIGSASGAAGAGASGGLGAGVSGGLLGGTVCGLSACHIAAVVSTAAITAGGAAEIERLIAEPAERPHNGVAAAALPPMVSPLTPTPTVPAPAAPAALPAPTVGTLLAPAAPLALAGTPLLPVPTPEAGTPGSAEIPVAATPGVPAVSVPLGPSAPLIAVPVLPAPIRIGPAETMPPVYVTVPAPRAGEDGGRGSAPSPASTGRPAPVPEGAASTGGLVGAAGDPEPVIVGATGNPVVGGARQPDAAVGGVSRPDPVVGGAGEPDPIVGGAGEPDPIVGGAGEPDPIVGGAGQPDPIAGEPDPVVGGAGGPDPVAGEPDPVVGGAGEPHPIAGDLDPVVGGAGEPDPIVGGAGEPDPGLPAPGAPDAPAAEEQPAAPAQDESAGSDEPGDDSTPA